jgi:hypothetical protein
MFSGGGEHLLQEGSNCFRAASVETRILTGGYPFNEDVLFKSAYNS